MLAKIRVFSNQGEPARDPAFLGNPVACVRPITTGPNGGLALNDYLIAVGKSRDREAFAALFGHFAPRIKAFMLKRGCDSATAEELAQMTLIKVWEKAVLFNPEKASAVTWIFTIARNLHIDVIRKAKRPEPDPTDPFFVPTPEKPADTSIAEKQDANKVQAAISTLPSEQQDVLRLSFYEEKSHGEIAAQLGVPLGTVKSRMRLAFGKIRNVIGDIE
jgi:RNA polymerase sigma-70 factor (ECF subfamily)